MDALALLRKYLELDRDGGPLDKPRTNREYAALLGIDESQLSRCFSGQQGVGPKILRGIRNAFPVAAPEVYAIVLNSIGATPDDVLKTMEHPEPAIAD